MGFPPVAQYVAQGLIIVGAVAIPNLAARWRRG
jgi:ribose transport system permease protein